MQWTKDKPDESGWYWTKTEDYPPRIVEILISHTNNGIYDSVNEVGSEGIYRLHEYLDYEWYGPLEYPS